jgi:hypothetical protein
MNQDKYVFSQLTEFLERNRFNYIVRKHQGDKRNRGFTCWNQMLMMIFGQLSNRESLRDLITVIEAHRSKAYHLGFGRAVNLSTLARANQNRDWRIFEEFALHMIEKARLARADIQFRGQNRRKRLCVRFVDNIALPVCVLVGHLQARQRSRQTTHDVGR